MANQRISQNQWNLLLFLHIYMVNTSQENSNNVKTRPPVIVILGHVDHGKTSILDAIRTSKIAAKEAGGITQHIGAYQAEHEGKKITFLDTPGHEAFTAIRSRGARVADIAILVVAADEGIKPQTKEAIQIIQKTNIPHIVAINKMDKEGANPARVRQELAEQQIFVEGYGGNVPVIELSAKTGDGINALLEMILLVAELEDFKAPVAGPAKGVVIESHKDNRRGTHATVLVQEGMLKIGDWLSAGTASGKVKSLENFLGKTITEAHPSEPCVIVGWDTMPALGQTFEVVASKDIAEKNALEASLAAPKNLFVQESSDTTITTPKKIAYLIIKADVNSSLEAIDQVLRTIHSEEVTYRVMSYGVGDINKNDMDNARTGHASVIGFNVKIEEASRQMAERDHTTVRTFSIIYELVEVVREIMSELLEPEIKRTDLGRIKILALFKQEGKSQIIGGKVTQGKAVRGSMIDVLRNNKLILVGKLGQLQHNKQDVTEVTEGMETGMRFDLIRSELTNPRVPTTVAVGDILEIYAEERIKRSL